MSVDHIVMGSSTGGSASGVTYVDDVFSTYLYTGAGGSQTINNGIDFATYGGMIWGKPRNSTAAHVVIDTVRGGDSWLSTNNSTQAFPGTGNNQKIAFNTTGIVSDAVDGLNWSTSGATFSTWSFRKAPKFFDIVSYTGDGTSSKLLNHSLTVAPGMVLIKNTSVASNWGVWHVNGRGGALDGALALNLTDTPLTPSFSVSATTFRVYQGTTNFKMDPNVSGNNYIAYLFAHDPAADGIIRCGSFATSAGGAATINLGWEPQWLLIKDYGSGGNWFIFDTMRGMSYALDKTLRANTVEIEMNWANTYVTPTATGFTIANSFFGASASLIYMAICRSNKPPTSGTQVFSAQSYIGTSTARSFTNVGFSPDMIYYRDKAQDWGSGCGDRLRGSTNLTIETSDAEYSSAGTYVSFDMDGFSIGSNLNAFFNWGSHPGNGCNFKRAKGFFDIVCYLGTGSSVEQRHNLGVIPELCIFKTRSSVGDWVVLCRMSDGNYVYGSTVAASKFALNSSNPSTFTSSASGLSLSSSSFYTLGLYNTLNTTYVAYLFATLAGISKVGSYIGNGSLQTIACGFASGARFIIIKRTDAAGDWYTWDYGRGIVGANDPHMSLNTAVAEVTTDDSIDPDNSGFIVNQVAATNINVSSATYIFLAIA